MPKNYGKTPADSAGRLLPGSAAVVSDSEEFDEDVAIGYDLRPPAAGSCRRRKQGAWLSRQDVDLVKRNLLGLCRTIGTAFPKATTPPVTVTFGEAIIFAGFSRARRR